MVGEGFLNYLMIERRELSQSLLFNVPVAARDSDDGPCAVAGNNVSMY